MKNINFQIDKELKKEFDLKVQNDTKYKNGSDALNHLIFDYISKHDITINQDKDKKLFGFYLNDKAVSLLHFFGRYSEEYENNTHLVKEILKDYIKGEQDGKNI